MTQSDKRVWEGYVIQTVEDIIRNACGMTSGQNYKKYVPLMELIDYKVNANSLRQRGEDKETFRFKKFMEASDKIVELVASKWPFIDLEGMDLSWTSEQVVEQVVRMYATVPIRKLNEDEIPLYKDNSEEIKQIEEICLKHIGPHVNKRKKVNKTSDFKVAICEARGVEIPQRETRWGKENDFSSIKDQYEHIVKAIDEELKATFPNSNLYASEWNSIHKICKHYADNHKF